MAEICGDNRFELIEKYKTKLIEATNIETAKDEMAVIDSILFRFWQMGWLDKLEANVVPKSEVERLRFNLEAVLEEIPETKREVAREIFEEIDKLIIDSSHLPKCCRFIDIDELAELKKKYTESEDKE